MEKETLIVTKAKTAIILDHAFFATLMLKMSYVADEQIPTA
jgi:hypothetical protein